MTPSAPLAGLSCYLKFEKRRPWPARKALANNLPANAADMVKAVHGGTMICRVQAVKVLAELVQNTGKIRW